MRVGTIEFGLWDVAICDDAVSGDNADFYIIRHKYTVQLLLDDNNPFISKGGAVWFLNTALQNSCGSVIGNMKSAIAVRHR